MHLTRGWRDRAALAQARREAKQNPDDEALRIREIRARAMQAQQERMEAASAAHRLEQEGPVRAAARLLRDRLGDDLPEIMTAIGKAGGFAKLVPFLQEEANKVAAARREADHSAEMETRHETAIANRGRDLADMTARREKAAAAKVRYQQHVESRNATAATEEAAG